MFDKLDTFMKLVVNFSLWIICQLFESFSYILVMYLWYFLVQRLADFQRKIDKRPLENTSNKTMEEFKVHALEPLEFLGDFILFSFHGKGDYFLDYHLLLWLCNKLLNL